MTQARKVDANQTEIVIRLRKVGFKVFPTHRVGGGFPDLVVGGYHRLYGIPYLVLVEVKSDGGKLTEQEEEFFTTFHGMPIIVARRPSDVAEAFGWSKEEAQELNSGL